MNPTQKIITTALQNGTLSYGASKYIGTVEQISNPDYREIKYVTHDGRDFSDTVINAWLNDPSIIKHEFKNGVGLLSCDVDVVQPIFFKDIYEDVNFNNLKEVYIGTGFVEVIATCLQCEYLEKVVILEAEVLEDTFVGCTRLKKISLPNNLKNISNAFNNCNSLVVNIPDGVEVITEDSFLNVPHIYYNGSATGAPWGALAMN